MLDEIYLRLLLELVPSSLKLTGLDVRRLIEQFNDSSHSKRAYGELIKHIYLDTSDSDIGLKFGEHLHPATLCDLSRALMTTQSVQSALSLLEKYHFIHGASYYPIIDKRPGMISIALTFPYKNKVPLHQRRFCTEAVFSYINNALKETVCSSVAPLSVSLDYPKPVYAQSYFKRFNCQPSFDSPLSIITFDEQLLHRELTTHNPTLHQLYLNKSLDIWQKSERLQDFEYRTISQIMRDHPASFNSQKLASKLNISVRGLQKRLNKNGQSFSQLSNVARRELAKVYLYQMKQSIEFTAEQLGFQTASGFRRFFKTEFAQTPIEFIEAHCATENDASLES
jgi:AraC-like DNA-binding protein